MMFYEALKSLTCDSVIASRLSWHRSVYIKVQVPDRHSKMGCPYIYISTVGGELVPWLPSFEDLFATDWVVFK